jgi:formylglycine-generating enzyme
MASQTERFLILGYCYSVSKARVRNNTILLVVACLSTSFAAQEKLRSNVGLLDARPSTGVYVEVASKFMVPYKSTIPGTNTSFSMIPIPGGTFLMGSPPNGSKKLEDAGPLLEVEVQPIWVSKTEVTWGEYRHYMNLYMPFKQRAITMKTLNAIRKDVDAITAPTVLYEASHTFEFGDDPRLPAVTMTQYAAKQYTKWLSLTTGQQYRLPTEAEWEYSARAGSQAVYCFGDSVEQLDEYACYWENSGSGPSRVGSKKANAFGLHDMHGNVWEWTIEGYASDGNRSRKDRVAGFEHNVKLPDESGNRCVRGGGWQHSLERCRSAARIGSDDDAWNDIDPDVPQSPHWFTSDPARSVGFRIVRSLTPLNQEAAKLFWEYDHPEIERDVNMRIDDGRGGIGLIGQ